jgi:hypothetical protein
MRTIKIDVEGRLGKRIPLNHPLNSWILEHSALLISALRRNDDGVTPWAKVRGRPFAMDLLPFGESIFRKQPTKGHDTMFKGTWAHDYSMAGYSSGTAVTAIRTW